MLCRTNISIRSNNWLSQLSRLLWTFVQLAYYECVAGFNCNICLNFQNKIQLVSYYVCRECLHQMNYNLVYTDHFASMRIQIVQPQIRKYWELHSIGTANEIKMQIFICMCTIKNLTLHERDMLLKFGLIEIKYTCSTLLVL